MAQRFILGVDLDGVVGDFYEFMRNVAAEWLGVPVDDLTPEVTYGLPEWNIKPEQYNDMHRFAVTQRDLFRKMQVIPGAAPALRRLSDADVHIRIITGRSTRGSRASRTRSQTRRRCAVSSALLLGQHRRRLPDSFGNSAATVALTSR